MRVADFHDSELRGQSGPALRDDNTEFLKICAQGIDQHRFLASEEIPATMQHQHGLLISRLDGNGPHIMLLGRLANGRSSCDITIREDVD